MSNIYRAKYRKARKLFALDYLGSRCKSCGASNNLEFDHTDPTTKEFHILDTLSLDKNIKVFIKELDKCQLLCKPCHWEKTKIDLAYNLPNHGSISYYSNHGCRCLECKEVNRLQSQAHRDKNKLSNSKE